MKKESKFGWKIMVIAYLLIFLTLPLVSAEKKIFYGTGEYTMSDYETPAVAEQRALIYAKKNAAEQAGVYVENYTRMENMEVTEDRVNMLINSVMKIIDSKSEKRALPSGDIHLLSSIIVEIDINKIDSMINNKAIHNIEKIYQQNKQESMAEEEETNELKKRISEMKQKNMAVDDLKSMIKEKENEFLCNQKIDAVIALWGEDKYKEALNIAEEAVRINPKSYRAYAVRGGTYGYLGDYDNTIKDINRALTLNDKHAWSYNAKGYAYSRKGDIDYAVNNYKKAISIDPKYEIPYLNWGNIFFDKKDYFRAKDIYNRILKFNTQSGNAYYNLGITCYYLGVFDEAVDNMKKALLFKGEVVDEKEAHRMLGYLYSLKGDYKNAMKEYDKAKKGYENVIKKNPKNEMAQKNIQIIDEEMVKISTK